MAEGIWCVRGRKATGCSFGSSTSGAEIGEIANLKDDQGMICV